MIPRFVIVWLTFPGVIVRQFVVAIVCKWLRIPVYEIEYFHFSAPHNPRGYVAYGMVEQRWKLVVAVLAPFLFNTLLGAFVGATAAIPLFKFGTGDLLDYVLMWLGVSIATQAWPDSGQARAIWKYVSAPGASLALKIFCIPIVGAIYVGSCWTIVWADVAYGVAVAGLLPLAVVRLFS